MAGREARRLARERRTINAMIAIYCRDHHQRRGLCIDCAGLAEYAGARLDRCPYGETKPTCVNCPVHCYAQRMRDAVREVMRYAGPRMMGRHPILAIAHALDGRRKVPPPPGPGSQTPPSGGRG